MTLAERHGIGAVALRRGRRGADSVPTYLSMYIIARMTRQALTRLIATLQVAQGVTLVRASASQMAGRLVCEFEAPDQETLLQFFAAHRLTYEWIIRVELAWGAQAAGTGSAPEAAAAATPGACQESELPMAATSAGRQPQVPSEPSAAAEPRPAVSSLPRSGEAKCLHMLRALRDESAWQLIAVQHATQPVVVLLIHDAVLAPPPLDVPMFACEADVRARGAPSPLALLTDDQIVELVFACERVIVW